MCIFSFISFAFIILWLFWLKLRLGIWHVKRISFLPHQQVGSCGKTNSSSIYVMYSHQWVCARCKASLSMVLDIQRMCRLICFHAVSATQDVNPEGLGVLTPWKYERGQSMFWSHKMSHSFIQNRWITLQVSHRQVRKICVKNET